MTLRKGKWASPGKKGTPSKTRRRSVNRSSLSSVSRTISASAVKKPLAANIKVAVRVRPENEREQAGNYDNIINVVDKNMLVFDPKDCDDTFFFKGKTHKMRDLNKKEKKDKNFTFDNVYGTDSTNQEVFEGTTKGIVDTLFDGYNCCVFAYGATGAGKTHTMLGNQNNPGITFLTMKEIFMKQATIDDMNFELFLSYIEVYNEGLRDLLDPTKPLIIREDGKAGTTIAGMTMLKPQSPDEVLNLLR
jgi:kinesin family protein 18/19